MPGCRVPTSTNWRVCGTCKNAFHLICAEQLRENVENVSITNCGCADADRTNKQEQEAMNESNKREEIVVPHTFAVEDEVAVIIDDKWLGGIITHLLDDGTVKVRSSSCAIPSPPNADFDSRTRK
jgi:hypothetical protein